MRLTYIQDETPVAESLVVELLHLSLTVFGSEDRLDGTWRIQHMPDFSSFSARGGEALIGFKLGYALTSKRYYSWLGGVHPEFQRDGVARELMQRQHSWIASRD